MERMMVIGAGTMGLGIAHVGALAGFDVALSEKNAEQLDRAMTTIASNLKKGVERGKLSQADADAALARVHRSEDFCNDAESADVLIEAVFEDIDLKKKVLSHLDEHARPDALIGTNTSSLSLTQLAAATKRPERVIGMHFFNPVHVMALLEIVMAGQTTAATRDRTLALAQRLGKTPIVVKDAPGFATSRLGVCLGLEAIRMVEQGVASPADIDTALELGYRHAMGPLKLTDLVGLDVRLNIADHLARELTGDQYTAPELLRRMVAEGKLGKKTGEGFYRWDGNDARPVG